MDLFRTKPPAKFNSEDSPQIQKKFIGEFSIDGNKQIYFDNRNLARVKLDGFDENMTKEIKDGFDLKKGIDRAIKYDNTNTKLNYLLKWMLNEKDKITIETQSPSGVRKRIEADFVCRRGVLQEIMRSPFSYFEEGWIILATKFEGTIYLCEESTPEQIKKEEDMSEREKDNCRLGYKFEQYMKEDANTSDPVNENEQYNCVLKSKLGEHSLLYRAEVDGVDTELYEPSATNLSSFLELKTTNKDFNDMKLKNKMQKWWYQSYLAGIPKVVCGFKNDDRNKNGRVIDDDSKNHGIVKKITVYNVNDLPEKCKDCWSDKVMLNCLNEFLSWVKKQVTKDNDKIVYKFTKKENEAEVTCQCLGEESSEKTFLPEWYTKAILQ